MYDSDSDLMSFERDGYLLREHVFSEREIATLLHELPPLMARDDPRRVMETDGRTVRALHGTHEINQAFDILARHPRLVEPTRLLLGSDVYVHQFKLNVKAAFAGDVWRWHQDFIFWLKQDGMREPNAVNAMVFLDDVTEFNGPLFIVPGSHTDGVIDEGESPTSAGADGDDGWHASVAADIKYAISRETLADLVSARGMVSPKGPRGSVLFTHCNLVHGSPPNMSPFDRRLAIVTYNDVKNALDPVDHPRPEFLVSRNFTPIRTVDDDALSSYAGEPLTTAASSDRR